MKQRTIKFRAWDKKQKQMVGHVISNVDPYLTLDLDGCLRDRKLFDYSNQYILMQYTGLKDKNEEEIYEGDIVEFHAHVRSEWTDYYGKGKIVYRPDGMTFVIDTRNEGDWLVEDTTHYDEPCIEVISNIYENPELLRGGEPMK